MNFTSPFNWLMPHKQKKVFVLLLAGTVIVGAVLQVLGSSLTNEVAPLGILSYEFAGSLTNANRILESWGVDGRTVAGLHIGLDYSFLLFYSLTIGLGCSLVAQSSGIPFIRSLGIAISWLQLMAAGIDAVENYGLIRTLLGSGSLTWVVVAFWCAALKFALILLGMLFLLIGGLSNMDRKRRGETTESF